MQYHEPTNLVLMTSSLSTRKGIELHHFPAPMAGPKVNEANWNATGRIRPWLCSVPKLLTIVSAK